MAIDIQYLIDKLESLIERGRRVPFTAAVLVDEGACLDIIDQMRISIPEEIKQAKRLQQERERIVAEARDEGARIVSKAREDAARLVTEHEMRHQAEEQASRILEEARRQAQIIEQGADRYAEQVLNDLNEQLLAIQRTVANGLNTLRERQQRRREGLALDNEEIDDSPEPETGL